MLAGIDELLCFEANKLEGIGELLDEPPHLIERIHAPVRTERS